VFGGHGKCARRTAPPGARSLTHAVTGQNLPALTDSNSPTLTQAFLFAQCGRHTSVSVPHDPASPLRLSGLVIVSPSEPRASRGVGGVRRRPTRPMAKKGRNNNLYGTCRRMYDQRAQRIKDRRTIGVCPFVVHTGGHGRQTAPSTGSSQPDFLSPRRIQLGHGDLAGRASVGLSSALGRCDAIAGSIRVGRRTEIFLSFLHFGHLTTLPAYSEWLDSRCPHEPMLGVTDPPELVWGRPEFSTI